MPTAMLELQRNPHRRIRFDSASTLQGALGTVPGDTSWTQRRLRGVLIPDRRREERFAAVSHWAWLGWRRWRGFRMSDALIVNISRGGALVFLDEPPARRTAWLFVETPDLHTILEARVLEVIRTRSGQCAVRLAFRQPPPLGLFDVAVCGLSAVDPKLRAVRPAPGTTDPAGRGPEPSGR